MVQVKDFLNGSWDTVSQEQCNRVKSESETYRPDGLVERWAVMPWCLFSVYLAPKLFMTIKVADSTRALSNRGKSEMARGASNHKPESQESNHGNTAQREDI